MAAHAYRLSALISLLLFALAATAAGTTTKTPMQLQLFDATPGLQCSDGSAHGVYVEGPERPAGWVLWISGGGACRNATDCRRKLKKDPWKFGSSSWPSTIGGDSLLSADKETNPETFAYEKWMVPYCSQDLWMGGRLGGYTNESPPVDDEAQELSHLGAALFANVLRAFEERVAAAGLPALPLVIVGSSAGGIGLLNHVDEVLRTAQRLNLTDVRFLFESSIFSAETVADVNWSYMNVSLQEFPACGSPVSIQQIPRPPGVDTGSSSQTGQTADKNAPCCLVTSCMLENDSVWGASGGTEAVGQSPPNSTLEWSAVFLASPYDPLNLQLVLSEGGEGKKLGIADGLGLSETVGALRQSVSQLLQSSTASTGAFRNRVRFMMPSCLTHMFLVASMDFMRLYCDGSGASCNATHIGASLSIQGVTMSMWLNEHFWSSARLFGQPIRDLISEYAAVGRNASLFQSLDKYGAPIGLWADGRCSGPNCQDSGCPSTIDVGRAFSPLSPAMSGITLGFFLAATAMTWVCLLVAWCWNVKANSSGRLPILNYLTRMSSTLSNSSTDSTTATSVPFHSDRVHAPTKLQRHKTGRYHPSFSALSNLTNTSAAKIVVHLEGITAWAAMPEHEKRLENEKHKVLLNRATMTLSRGRVVALIGPSGSGKSTFLSVLTETLPPTIFWTGKRSSQANHIRFLRQGAACPFTRLTAGRFLELEADLVSAPQSMRQFVEGWVDHFRDTPVSALSGGQNRILSTASCLLSSPDVLVLDEPTSGLDAFSTLELGKLLQEAAKQCNTAVVMSVHQPSVEFLQHADEILMLKAGCIYFKGPPSELEELVNSSPGLCSAEEDDHGDHLKTNYADVAISALQLADDPLPHRRSTSEALDEDGTTSLPPPGMLQVPLPFFESHIEYPPSVPNHSVTSPFAAHTVIMLSRMALQWKMEYADVARLVISFAVMGGILSLRAPGVPQVMIGITAALVISVNLLRYKVLRMCDYWRFHKVGLIDKITRRSSFFIASQLLPIMFALPSILGGMAVYFQVLGWPWGAYWRLCTITVLIFQVSTQTGRIFSLALDGDYTQFAKWLSLWYFTTFLFGGSFVPIADAPVGLRWLFYISPTFWAITGGTMAVIQEQAVLPGCEDLMTCTVMDSEVLAYYLGLAPYSSSMLAGGILLGLYVVFVVAEALLLIMQTHTKDTYRAAPPSDLQLTVLSEVKHSHV